MKFKGGGVQPSTGADPETTQGVEGLSIQVGLIICIYSYDEHYHIEFKVGGGTEC